MSSKFSVLAAKVFSLSTLIFCLLAAFGLFVTQAVGEFEAGPLVGYFIYCIVTALLTRDVYRARPISGELDAKGGETSAVGPGKFVLLLIVVAFLMALTLPALAFGAFDTWNLIFFVVTSLLAWATFRAKGVARAFVSLLLATVAFTALAAGASRYSYGGTPRSAGPEGSWLEGQVTGLRKENNLIGFAAMVMIDGKVVATAADGERMIRSGVPIELADRWHLGSITKSVTATMIARLIESGQMEWTETIGEHFAESSVQEAWKDVTLEQLLTHTSGAPSNFPISVRLRGRDLGARCTEERRKAVLGVLAQKPDHPPGESFVYSNVGYTIAGAIAERVTGVSWEDLVKREVFAPLNLEESGFGPPKSPAATLDQPRGHRASFGWKSSVSDTEDNTPIIGPAGTVHMTLENLCRYATDHLRGELGQGKLLTAESYKKLHTPRLRNYACGWVVKPPSDEIPETAYWHNGSNTMWYALVVFIPARNMVVAVTANDGDIKSAESAAWRVVNGSVKQFNDGQTRSDGEGHP